MTEFTVVFTGIPNNPRSSKPFMPSREYACTLEKIHSTHWVAKGEGYLYNGATSDTTKQGLMRYIREAHDTHADNESRWSVQ